MNPGQLSVVVQGPVARGGVSATATVLASLRRAFPGAELVLSTWVGSDTDGLDADVIVHSDDPGVGARNSNVNRQVRSSQAGIEAATRTYALKTRTDILFGDGSVLAAWGQFRERAALPTRFSERILASSLFTRRPSLLAPYPFHPGDWVFLGVRDDVRTLFQVPVQTPAMTEPLAEPQELHRTLLRVHGGTAHRAIPEQYLMHEALRSVLPNEALRYWCDLTPETLLATEVAFAQEFVVLDAAEQWKLLLPKYAASGRLLRDATLLDHDAWRALYQLYSARSTRVAPDARVRGQRWEHMLRYTMAQAPALVRDETGGGGALRSRALTLAALASAQLGAGVPRAWTQAPRAGMMPLATPVIDAGGNLRLPRLVAAPEQHATTPVAHGGAPQVLLAPDCTATRFCSSDDLGDVADDVLACAVLPAATLGRPAHEQRLARLQALARVLRADGSGVLELPWSGATADTEAYLRNDLLGALDAASASATRSEVPLGELAPLVRDTALVGLAIDDYVATGDPSTRRLWIRVRHGNARPDRRVVTFAADVAERFGAAPHAGAKGEWTVQVAPAVVDRARTDAIGVAAGRRPSALVVSDAWVAPGMLPVLTDDLPVHLVVDVGPTWAAIDRAARLAMVRARLLFTAGDRETLLRLHLLAPHVPTLLLEGQPCDAATSTTRTSGTSVLVDRTALAAHPNGAIGLDAVRLLQGWGVTVRDGAIAAQTPDAVRYRITIGASERIFTDVPTPWLLARAAALGITLPTSSARRLPAALPRALSRADVVCLDVPMHDAGGSWTDALSVWHAGLSAGDIAHAIRRWLDDDVARLRHAQETVSSVLARYTAPARLRTLLAYLDLQGMT